MDGYSLLHGDSTDTKRPSENMRLEGPKVLNWTVEANEKRGRKEGEDEPPTLVSCLAL